jgi:2-keto-3-deoxy-L-rhamnonate aldolase RhmA
MKPNSLHTPLAAGKTVVGAMTFEFFSPGMSAILANSGCQFVIYDMEHTGLGFETLKWLFSTCRGLPIEPMVRVPRGQYTYLARALDIGARGVMVPMVESAEQAAEIVEACRYPPVGRRGAGFGFAQCDYLGGDVGQKIAVANQRTTVIAQIETERGLAAVDAIAATPGIDVLWLGHFDLTNFMGIPARFDAPEFQSAMKRIAHTARAHGKAAGFMATDRAWIDQAREYGYNMLAVGTDVGLLASATAELTRHAANGRSDV